MILVYKGPFTLQVVASLGDFIRALPIDNTISRNRLFKSLIEIAQNISLYSAEQITFKNGNTNGIGYLEVHEDSDYYIIHSKNKIELSEFEKLAVYCNKIKNLNQEELRKLKSLNIKNKEEKENSAHLGFIFIAILTQNNIEFQLDTENGSFEIFVKIKRQIDNY